MKLRVAVPLKTPTGDTALVKVSRSRISADAGRVLGAATSTKAIAAKHHPAARSPDRRDGACPPLSKARAAAFDLLAAVMDRIGPVSGVHGTAPSHRMNRFLFEPGAGCPTSTPTRPSTPAASTGVPNREKPPSVTFRIKNKFRMTRRSFGGEEPNTNNGAVR